MSGITRRKFGLGLGVAGCAGLSGLPVSAMEPIAIPAGPMRLSRRITRHLGDGKAIIVHREWQVAFAAQGRGITVSGSQLMAKVDAPEQLAPIAKIEQERSTDGMWPILLSSNGHIVAAGDHALESDISAAAQTAQEMLAGTAQPASRQARHKHYLAQMQQASAALIDQLPADLFFPAGRDQQLVRAIDLPEGMKGEFELIYTAKSAPGGAWLSKATRRITTRIGGDARTAQEDWVLAEI
uniref:hypothetical protein n=1 Tax=uncultured Erythrobacter sp. TaxID=263913 RepID=UPI0026140421|nr:hypothetical protein [uncultured Erythrobacter sp.]